MTALAPVPAAPQWGVAAARMAAAVLRGPLPGAVLGLLEEDGLAELIEPADPLAVDRFGRLEAAAAIGEPASVAHGRHARRMGVGAATPSSRPGERRRLAAVPSTAAAGAFGPTAEASGSARRGLGTLRAIDAQRADRSGERAADSRSALSAPRPRVFPLSTQRAGDVDPLTTRGTRSVERPASGEAPGALHADASPPAPADSLAAAAPDPDGSLDAPDLFEAESPGGSARTWLNWDAGGAFGRLDDDELMSSSATGPGTSSPSALAHAPPPAEASAPTSIGEHGQAVGAPDDGPPEWAGAPGTGALGVTATSAAANAAAPIDRETVLEWIGQALAEEAGRSGVDLS